MMKKPSNSFIILFIIVTVSVLGVRCQNSTTENPTSTNANPTATNANPTSTNPKPTSTNNPPHIENIAQPPAKNCKDLNADCYHNNECCTQNCQRSDRHFRGYCDLPTESLSSIGNVDTVHRIYPNHCLYYRQNNSAIKTMLYKRFDVNAAHSEFPPRSKVLVATQHSQVIVTISDQKPKTNNTLELSEEAAHKLGVGVEGTIPCHLKLLIPSSPSLNFLRNIIFVFPFFAFSVGAWLYSV